MKNRERTDKRLRKTYGITLYEYNALLAAQGDGCSICGAAPVTRALHVDHDHALARTKIRVKKMQFSGLSLWHAEARRDGNIFEATEATRQKAIENVRSGLLRRSIRGLVCHRCNRGLQMFSDVVERLESAAAYLRRFAEKGSPILD